LATIIYISLVENFVKDHPTIIHIQFSFNIKTLLSSKNYSFTFRLGSLIKLFTAMAAIMHFRSTQKKNNIHFVKDHFQSSLLSNGSVVAKKK